MRKQAKILLTGCLCAAVLTGCGTGQAGTSSESKGQLPVSEEIIELTEDSTDSTDDSTEAILGDEDIFKKGVITIGGEETTVETCWPVLQEKSGMYFGFAMLYNDSERKGVYYDLDEAKQVILNSGDVLQLYYFEKESDIQENIDHIDEITADSMYGYGSMAMLCVYSDFTDGMKAEDAYGYNLVVRRIKPGNVNINPGHDIDIWSDAGKAAEEIGGTYTDGGYGYTWQTEDATIYYLSISYLEDTGEGSELVMLRPTRGEE